MLLGQIGQVDEWVEVTCIGLSCGADDHRRRAVELTQEASQRLDVKSTDIVTSEDLNGVTSVAEHLQGLRAHWDARNRRRGRASAVARQGRRS